MAKSEATPTKASTTGLDNSKCRTMRIAAVVVGKDDLAMLLNGKDDDDDNKGETDPGFFLLLVAFEMMWLLGG